MMNRKWMVLLAAVASAHCSEDNTKPLDSCKCAEGWTCVADGCALSCTDDESCAGVGVEMCGADAYCMVECPVEECAVLGTCFPTNAANPDNPCESCVPTLSRVRFSANDSATCDDGAFCTTGDHCSGGRCVFDAVKDCDDETWCTNDACDEGGDSCVNEVAEDTCLIDDTCWVGGTPDPDNVCLACDPTTDAEDWSPTAEKPCDDGAFCSVGDRCVQGACVPTGDRDCADALDCTTDGCDDTGDACAHILADDACLIDGECVADGAPDPGNPCVECQPEEDQTAWTNNDTNVCDDGLFCTAGDHCTAGTCVFANMKSCNDGAWCTDDACDEDNDRCANDVAANTCLIDTTCWVMGAANPANVCLACVPTSDSADWSATVGNECDDNRFCTVGDHCDLGECVAEGLRDCSDELACTTDSCDDDASACTNLLAEDACLIDGECVSEGVPDPANPCVECQPMVSQNTWTADNSNSCEDRLFCTLYNHCEEGSCVFVSPCNDGVGCTRDICDEEAEACSFVLFPNACFIDNICYQRMDPGSDDPCERCIPDNEQEAFTFLAPKMVVADGDTSTCHNETLTASCIDIRGTLQTSGSCRLEAEVVSIFGVVDGTVGGYPAAQGPGAGPQWSQSGGSYGGRGGTMGDDKAGPVYGDVDDMAVDMGSGGSTAAVLGGAGGGKIEIISEVIELTGVVRANGGNGTNHTWGTGGGSGAESCCRRRLTSP